MTTNGLKYFLREYDSVIIFVVFGFFGVGLFVIYSSFLMQVNSVNTSLYNKGYNTGRADALNHFQGYLTNCNDIHLDYSQIGTGSICKEDDGSIIEDVVVAQGCCVKNIGSEPVYAGFISSSLLQPNGTSCIGKASEAWVNAFIEFRFEDRNNLAFSKECWGGKFDSR